MKNGPRAEVTINKRERTRDRMRKTDRQKNKSESQLSIRQNNFIRFLRVQLKITKLEIATKQKIGELEEK